MDAAAKSEKARELFLAGANCAHAVFGAFCEECGVDFATAMKLASGFGGGIARSREVCGAVSGMVMAADLLYAAEDFQDKAAKDAQYARVHRLLDEFRRENGSIVCRELLGLAPRQSDSPVSEPRTQEYYRKRPCAEIVAQAAAILTHTPMEPETK